MTLNQESTAAGQADGTPEPTPEGLLIERRQKRSGIPQRQAAELAGISDSRWRQVVKGYQVTTAGPVPSRAKASTLARMALAVGVPPGDLRAAGREDAAEIMENGALAPPPETYAVEPMVSAVVALMLSLPPEHRREVIQRVKGAPSAPTHLVR